MSSRIADGAPLWSERYDRDLTDVFAVQDEIANAILEQLKTHLLDEAFSPPPNPSILVDDADKG